MRITSQAIQMLERMIGIHKKALEDLKSQGATKSQIEYVEKSIRNYEEQLKRLRSQADEIEKPQG